MRRVSLRLASKGASRGLRTTWVDEDAWAEVMLRLPLCADVLRLSAVSKAFGAPFIARVLHHMFCRMWDLQLPPLPPERPFRDLLYEERAFVGVVVTTWGGSGRASFALMRGEAPITIGRANSLLPLRNLLVSRRHVTISLLDSPEYPHLCRVEVHGHNGVVVTHPSSPSSVRCSYFAKRGETVSVRQGTQMEMGWSSKVFCVVTSASSLG